MTREELMSLRVVEKVANREGVPSSELSPPIYDVIDTDALDSLYGSTPDSRVQPTLEFTYKGYFVHIDSTGQVHVDEAGTALDPDAHGLSC
ncbi:hypothetical protein HALLA_20280 (plasmid) [Halostagnicola larsenii XH-48]|uniref:Halobacterial output domain-containing protein n=1 Tax=Halostagnicola larsenii XH-48 TaxID=797299 RepID=W0JUI4_9EURY|nr:HalOD1 output domain-containing protein [Halostagnicola larsenii]AHG02241.1 hypothetical protein HALLA_20280 [Halostagnicola larsenii XH-48]